MNKHYLSRQPVAGFTLIEMLVVIIMVGILSAIAVPSYLGLLNRQRLNVAQDQVFITMRNAQANAKRERRSWAACFRDNGTIMSSVYPLPESSTTWSCNNATSWQPLGSDSTAIAIDTGNTSITANPATYYLVQFKYDGTVAPQYRRRITLNIRNETNGLKRCVFISTLLGALRSDRDAACLIDDP